MSSSSGTHHRSLLTRALSTRIAQLALSLAAIEVRRKRGPDGAGRAKLSARGRRAIIDRACQSILVADGGVGQDQLARLFQLKERLELEVAAFVPRHGKPSKTEAKTKSGRPSLLTRGDVQGIYGAKLRLWQEHMNERNALGPDLVSAIGDLRRASKNDRTKLYDLLDREVSDLHVLRYLLDQQLWPGCTPPPDRSDTLALKRMAKCVQRIRLKEALSLPGKFAAQVGSSG